MEKLKKLSQLSAQMAVGLSLEQMLVQASDLLRVHYKVDGLSLWDFDAQERCFRCTFYTGSLPSNLGKSIPETKIPASLLDPERFALFTTKRHMNAEETAFLEQYRRHEAAVADYLLTPIAPGEAIEGFLSIRTTCLIGDWKEDDLDTLLVVIAQIKERFLRDKYDRLLKDLQREKSLLDEIQDIAKVGGWEYDLATQSMYWSEETYRIYGYPVGSTIDAQIGIQHYEGEDKAKIIADFEQLLQSQTPYERELRFKDARGKLKWVRTTGRVRVTHGKPTHAFGAFEDITKEKMLINKEHDAHEYLATIINNLNDVIVTVSDTGTILTANARVEDVFGYTPAELVGQNVSCLMPSPYGEVHHQYIESYLKTGNAKILGIGRELPAMKKNQAVFPIELSLTEVLQDNERIFIGIIKDITERKNAEDKIYKLAYFNPLTNLPNAFSFEDHVTRHIEKVRLVNGKLLLVKLDIDNFGKINLSHGRKAGDYAISMLADRIRVTADANFELFHYRGDIFYFLSRHSHVQKEQELILNCEQLATKLFELLEDEIIIEGIKYKLNASIVSSIIDGSHATLEVLYELLNMAVKQVKSEGGNRHVVLDNRAHHYLERRSKIKARLPHAIANDELYLVLQPQLDVHKRYCACEVLIRWHSKELDFVPPNEFIEIAEETGDIFEIGQWILQQVAKLIATHQPKGKVAINISAKQLARADFEHQVLSAFRDQHAPLDKVVLEVTETTLVQDLDIIRAKLERLTALGIEFSIDDFGTGYSSLSYLQNLAIHEIKIDKSFVDEIRDTHKNVPIVDSIIQLAAGLGSRVVAEGVENINQFQYLADRRCELLQGYLFSKPLSIEDWLSFMRRHE